MKSIFATIAEILWFIIGEGVSRVICKDSSYEENNSTLTWILKLIFGFTLMSIVYAVANIFTMVKVLIYE